MKRSIDKLEYSLVAQCSEAAGHDPTPEQHADLVRIVCAILDVGDTEEYVRRQVDLHLAYVTLDSLLDYLHVASPRRLARLN